MERESRSPETELRDRAISSSEPCGPPRPKPFEDDDKSSRKRRRTSNGESRSLSVETTESLKEDSDSPDNSPASSSPSATTTSKATSTTIQDDSTAMNVDDTMDGRDGAANTLHAERTGNTAGSGATTTAVPVAEPAARPHTPENGSTALQPDHDGVDDSRCHSRPSHVTLSLRNSASRILDTIPSSPESLPQSPTPALPSRPDDSDHVQVSVEQSDANSITSAATLAPSSRDDTGDAGDGAFENVVQDVAEEAAEDTSSSPFSHSDTASPPVEVVYVQPGEDPFETLEPGVTLLAGDQGVEVDILADPAGDFPYLGSMEAPADIMTKLLNYMASDATVPQTLSEWIDSYLIFAKNASPQRAFASYQQSRMLWLALPDLVWGLPNLRTASFGVTDRVTREKLLGFCEAFARLTAYFVELDYRSLHQLRSADEYQQREFISAHYMMALASITRRDPTLQRDEDHILRLNERDEISEIMDQFSGYCRVAPPCGTLQLLDRLMQAQIALMPNHLRIMDNFAHITTMASFIIRETNRKLASGGLRQQTTSALQDRVSLGHRFFRTASATLSSIIENHITSLTFDNASNQISALGDIILYSLSVDHPDAVAAAAAFQEANPDIPPEYVPDAYAMEWRFSMYCRLIMCSQMQLRVMAVANLCQELVSCWRKYGSETSDGVRETRETPVLRFISNFLVSTGVVSYLLGPTCHPEITTESSNIVGFLAVSRTYTNAHTDLLWQTVTTTQDPRICEALIRMTGKIVHLFSYESTIYLCQKLLLLPIAAFTPTMREFCNAVMCQVVARVLTERLPVNTVYFSVCLRLLREASVPGSMTPTAYPDVQSFAIEKLTEYLRNISLKPEERQSLYRSCLLDIQQKSNTTLGSLCAINIINRQSGGQDLRVLTSEHNLTKLMVDELENAIRLGRELGFPAVISGNTNAPRRDILFQILLSYPSTLTPELGVRIWDMMIGPKAACREDRNASWKILNTCVRKNRNESNNFLSICFNEFLPHLPPECFCEGLLDFMHESLVPLVNDANSILLDEDEESADRGVLEQLWRIILTAPENTIECQATSMLVKDVYIESQSILTFPHHRSRKVHLALVNRCLQQLSAAANKLKAYYSSDSTSSGDDESSMVVVPSEAQVQEQEVLFIRSLHVLREFHRMYRARSQFAAPDLRLFITDGPHDIVGDPAELKYQSFDGDFQTGVLPLSIGKLNTASSLLASLKEATGFDNYRMYYRGQAFVPQESDISRSLEDLHIHSGLILVKREASPGTPGNHVRPGTSPVETEILSHFKELWDYLSMDEKLALEIHQFLTRLPVEEQYLHMFDKPGVLYTDVFTIGQPYKSLYAMYALREFLVAHQRAITPAERTAALTAASTQIAQAQASSQISPPASPPVSPPSGGGQENGQIVGVENNAPPGPEQNEKQTHLQAYLQARATAKQLIIAAIADRDVTQLATSTELQISLDSMLIEMLAHILSDPLQDFKTVGHDLDATLLGRLFEMLSSVMDLPPSETTERLIQLCFQLIMDCCALSKPFWTAFKEHETVDILLERLLLGEWHLNLRQILVKQISDKVSLNPSAAAVEAAVEAAEFREFFWPVVLGLVPKVVQAPSRCEEVFNLAFNLFQKMRDSKSPSLDVRTLVIQISNLLLSYTTFEDVTQPDTADFVAYGLVQMLNNILRSSHSDNTRSALPPDFASKIFWKHLFPPWQLNNDDENDSQFLNKKPFPQIIVHQPTRSALLNMIFSLVNDDNSQLSQLVRNLDQLVPCEKSDDDEPYHYELPQQFERAKSIRAPCGYVGLRNLSNTCYLNSLFTQLFMNVEFRRFLMNVEVRDDNNTQNLLFQTRVLFSFMQDSIRRFVDTQQCVAGIKTYEDTMIDIHNQMDVDEFYNLLFDRWEGQLLSADEKRQLRSFYGGQLVQQVRSKECEHVSERLEPFSAIQCDIKGKASLQESLQAYVDGEVMEGDNKYKCSTCDRHVDAVKRACLKDIPNHLIFHLKRFDFNLRTLQRSKINDYFAFPHKIDMRPYTIEQLSDPDKEMSADVFELVGILVHSGTAESGHYYSYIRERPSSRGLDVWVEFNDDIVSGWDPSLMEASCFGGTDFRPNHFNGDGNSLLIDKSYSAYMLFYQRSSSLVQEQQALVETGLNSPLRVTLPQELSDHIRHENTSLVRRHCLYDPQHVPFVTKVLGHLQHINSGGQCSASHALENTAIQMAMSHLDQVASRAKDLPDFQTLVNRITANCNKCPRCYMSLFGYFDDRHDVLRLMIQRSPEPLVRQETGNLMIRAFQSIKVAFPEQYSRYGNGNEESPYDRMQLDQGQTVMRSVAYMLRMLWDYFHVTIRSWPEVFGFMLAFVKLGRDELSTFLDMDGLRRALLVIAVDTSVPAEPQFMRMLNTVQRRLPTRPPSYENVIGLIDASLAGMYPRRESQRSRDEMFVEDGISRFSLMWNNRDADMPMSRTEYTIVVRDWVRDFGNMFVDKLITIDQNIGATGSIIARLMETHPLMESKVLTTLTANISCEATAMYQKAFLRMALLFVRKTRSPDMARQLHKHISQQCRGLGHGDGRVFFDTMQELFHGEGEGEYESDIPAILEGLEMLPVWVPGLLSYYDPSVAGDVESFLREHIFDFGPEVQFEEWDGGEKRAVAMCIAAQRLGIECLKYMQLYFVERGVQISNTTVAIFQRVIADCKPYYLSQETGDEAMLEEFNRLNTSVPESLKRLIVEDLEEDASDWNSSRGSSEPVDSLGDVSMQTATELNDVDLP